MSTPYRNTPYIPETPPASPSAPLVRTLVFEHQTSYQTHWYGSTDASSLMECAGDCFTDQPVCDYISFNGTCHLYTYKSGVKPVEVWQIEQ